MFNRTQLSIAVSATLASAFVATATDALAQTPQQLDRVEITGSSIKRIGAETALPVQVITREEIQRTGASNVEQLMQTVSANASSGGLDECFCIRVYNTGYLGDFTARTWLAKNVGAH